MNDSKTEGRAVFSLRLTGSRRLRIITFDGGVAEWSKAAVLKTVVPQGTVGSNPTSSALICNML